MIQFPNIAPEIFLSLFTDLNFHYVAVAYIVGFIVAIYLRGFFEGEYLRYKAPIEVECGFTYYLFNFG